jgi:hypothetical protein
MVAGREADRQPSLMFRSGSSSGMRRLLRNVGVFDWRGQHHDIDYARERAEVSPCEIISAMQGASVAKSVAKQIIRNRPTVHPQHEKPLILS